MLLTWIRVPNDLRLPAVWKLVIRVSNNMGRGLMMSDDGGTATRAATGGGDLLLEPDCVAEIQRGSCSGWCSRGVRNL